MYFITTAWDHVFGESCHPVGVAFDGSNVDQRFALSMKGSTFINVLAALIPPFRGITGVKEIGSILNCGHGTTSGDVERNEPRRLSERSDSESSKIVVGPTP
jgi:hypothetical protein